MTERVSYQIDGDDAIRCVGASWNAFATANGAPQMDDRVVGCSVWTFVSDETTRQVYRALIARVRAGQTATFSYRCDAPSLRRFMQMTMTSSAGHGVAFDSVTIRTETRVPLGFGMESQPCRDRMLRVCGWCKRMDVGGDWEEIDVAVECVGLFAGSPTPTLTHAMCPPCFARVMAEVEAR